MGELNTYLTLGFRHIVSIDAMDHILFLVVLAAIYRLRDWRAVVWVITAFTVGHSISLALAVTGWLSVPSAWVEFLIPVTIVATGIENLIIRDRATVGAGAKRRPVFALAFGLVHGAGFAGYLRQLLMDDVAWPLLGFNVGVEIGQLAVLSVIAVLLVILDELLQQFVKIWSIRMAPFQLRLTAVSAIVAVTASAWAWQRWPA